VDYLQRAIDGQYVQSNIEEPKPSVIKPNRNWTDSKEAKEWNEEPAHPNGYKEAWE
jgi:hypothetical protein